MGTVGATDVITIFSGPQTAKGIHLFDPRIGIFLFGSLDALVAYHKLGFYHVAVSYYLILVSFFIHGYCLG